MHNYLLTIKFKHMSENKKSGKAGLFLLWSITLLMTFQAIAVNRHQRWINKQNFSIAIQAAGKFDRVVYDQQENEFVSGADFSSGRASGLLLLGDTVVYNIRNEINFHRGDSVYIASMIALPQKPMNQQMLRDALIPAPKSVKWLHTICLLLWLVSIWKTWNHYYD